MSYKYLYETNNMVNDVLNEGTYENYLKHKIEYDPDPSGDVYVSVKGPVLKKSFTASQGSEGYKAKRMVITAVADKAADKVGDALRKLGLQVSGSMIWSGDDDTASFFLGYGFDKDKNEEKDIVNGFKKLGLKGKKRKSRFSNEHAYAAELDLNQLKKWM